MSKTIDERVVEMRFDNKHFESNVKTSMSTLDKLKKSLNLSGASKGLENVGAAAKNIDMSGLSKSVETIGSKFSALEVMAVTALVNITNSALNAGKQLIASLTIDQVMAGFTKYEQKIASVQTIMNATGKSIDEVNGYLDRLMWFSDETSYGFTDMTAALAQMTSSGGDIDNLIPLITGVANATAYAGKGASEFSRAMYNLNQSYGAGSLQYMDWKSLELAGVASEQLKQVFIDTGVALGKIGENEVTVANFGSTLKNKWADTAVMEAAFGKFSELSEEAYKLVEAGQYDTASEAMEALAGQYSEIAEKAFKSAQQAKSFTEAIDATKDAVSTGWMKTFELLFGNIEEATVLWTGFTNTLWDVFASGAEGRNDMLAEWKELGGRDSAIQSLVNAFEALSAVVAPVKEAFRNIFPKMTADRLLALTKRFEEFTAKLKIGDETSDKIKRTFSGLFAVLDLVRQGFSFVFKAAGELFGLFGAPIASKILDVTASIGDFLVKVNDAAKQGDIFGRAFEGVKNVLTTVADKIKDAIKRISSAFKGFDDVDLGPLDKFSVSAEAKLKPFERLGKIFGAAFEAVVKVLEWAAPIVAKLGSIISKGLGKLADKVSYAVENMEFNEILDLVNTGLFGAILIGIKKFIGSLTEITSGASGFLSGITGILDGVRGALEAYQSNLKAKTLMTIASAIGILAVSIGILSLIDSKKLATSLAAITVLFIELSAAMIGIQKALGGAKMAKVSLQLVAMATAILILSKAMVNLADLDWEGVAKGTVGIAALAAVLVIAANSFDKSSRKLIRGATGLIAFAAAVYILSKAVAKLSVLSWEDLAKGLTGLTAIIAEVVAVTYLMGNAKRMVSTGVGMIALAAAMLIFAEAVKRMGQLSWPEIGKGLTTMAGALAAVTLALNLMPKGMINKAVGLIGVAAALVIIGSAVKKMGSMSWEEIARGLSTLAGSLAAITLALNLMPKGMINKAVGLIGVAAALTILIKPLREMGGMEWEEIAKGLVALAGTMTVLAIALNLMKKAIPGAAAMLIVAPALAILAGVLKTLGGMSLVEIGVGLLALAGVFTVLGVSALVLKPLIPTMLGLAAAIAIFSVGIMALGVGVLAFSAGLTALSVSATAAAGAIVIIGSALMSLIPMLFEKIGEGIIALCGVIINGAPLIKDAFLVLLASAFEAVTEATPMIVDGVFTLLISLFDALIKHTPVLANQLFDFIIGLLETLTQRLPELINAGVGLVMSLFSGIIDALSGINVDVLLKGIAGIGLMTGIMFALGAVASLIPGAMIGVLGMGVVIAELALVLAAIGALAQIPGLSWLIDEGGKLLESVGVAIGSFVGGIVGGFMSGVSGQFPQIGADLSAFMTNIQPFIEGASKIDPSMMAGVQALASTILILTAANILDGLTSWFTGGASLTKFAEQLVPFGKAMKAFAAEVDGIDGDILANAALAGKTLAEMAATLPNSGGIAGFFAGENDMLMFGEQLVPFGRAMKDFSVAVKGLDADVVTNAANAGEALGIMASALPNTGGVAGIFAGNNDMDDFGEQLIPFGRAMKGFSLAVAGMDTNVVANAANAGEALGIMASALPNRGGVAGFFAGENDMSIIAEQLVPFGEAMKGFSIAVKGIEGDSVKNAAMAGKTLAEMAAALPNSGGVAGFFAGENDMSKFGEQIILFGLSFASYANSVKDVPTDKLSDVAIEFGKLVTLANDISSVDSNGLSTFGKSLTDLGETGVDGFISAFTDAGSRVKTAATNMLETFISGAKAMEQKVTAAFVTMVTNAMNAVTKKKTEFKTAGSALIAEFIAGMKTKETAVKDMFKNMLDGTIEAIKNQYEAFRKAAVYLVEGFVKGIADNVEVAAAKSREMAAASVEAIEDELDEHSPSRVGYGLGDFFGGAFVSAIKDHIAKARDAGSGMGEAARAGLSKATSAISNVLDGNYDLQPTIRPVLDLSSVESGAGTIGKLLNGDHSVGMLAKVGTLGAMMSDNQNGGNSDILSALHNLGKLISGIQPSTYTVNGVTYDDGSTVSKAVSDLVRAVRLERRT